MKRVLVADDHDAVREGLRALLEAVDDLEIVAEASSGEEAVKLARALKPDIAVLDVRMPGLGGLAAAWQILNYSPRTALIALSLSCDEHHVTSALLAGMHGYIVKDEAAECLPEAIKAIRSHRLYLSPSATSVLHRSGLSTISSAVEQELLDLFDLNSSALFQSALIAGADEATAGDALRESFLAYSFARIHPEKISNLRAWFDIFITTLVFERCPMQLSAPRARSNIAAWWRSKFQPHPYLAEFAAYWSGALGDDSRSRLLEHLRSCSLCHLEWCLVASHAHSSQHEDPPADVISISRSRLVTDLRASDIGMRTQCLRAYHCRINQLIASELDMFFGAAAAAQWKGMGKSPDGSFSTPISVFDRFMGGRMAAIISMVLPSPALNSR